MNRSSSGDERPAGPHVPTPRRTIHVDVPRTPPARLVATRPVAPPTDPYEVIRSNPEFQTRNGGS